MSNRFVREAVVERFLRQRGVKVLHCGSCHSDEDAGYSSQLSYPVDLGRDRYTHLCCGLLEDFKKFLKEDRHE